MATTLEAAQAVLTAFDTSMSKHWREEDRRWRAEDRQWREEDMGYRREERKWYLEEAVMRADERRWREEDVAQRNVDNARYLWSRFVEKNRRDVEEKSEQLKAISNLSALFAGFAVVTLTQFQVAIGDSPLWVIAIYGVLTATSVCLHTVGMVLCTLVLGSILKNGKSYVDEEAEEEFMFLCKLFIDNFQSGDRPPSPRRTFEAFWEYRCEDDWRRAFNFFTWGVLSFLASLIPIGWIKFKESTLIASLFMAIVIISIAVWAWQQLAWGSYLTASRHRDSLLAQNDAPRVDPSGLPFDFHVAPEATRRKANSPTPSDSIAASRSLSSIASRNLSKSRRVPENESLPMASKNLLQASTSGT